MTSYAYYNGRFDTREKLFIPLSDRSIFFGDAIYDAAIGSYDRILWEDEHISRFLENAKKIGIKHEYTHRLISDLLHEVAIKSKIEEYFIYFQLSRGLDLRTHSANGARANLLITVDPFKLPSTPSPMKLITVKDTRHDLCNIKTVNLLPAVLSVTTAENQGSEEAVFVRKNVITECSKSNISIINQGRLITHPKNSRILPGIARKHLLDVARTVGFAIEERPFSVKEMLSADEILVTSTTKLCKPASHINQCSVGGSNSPAVAIIYKMLYSEYSKYCLTKNE